MITTLINTFFACSRFWIMLYGMILIIHDMFFTIFPTTLVVISALTLVLHFTKIPTPPEQCVNAVFGTDPSISTPLNGLSIGSVLTAQNFMSDILSSQLIGGMGRDTLQTALNALNLDSQLTTMATRLLLDTVDINNLVGNHDNSHRIVPSNYTTPVLSTTSSDQNVVTSGLITAETALLRQSDHNNNNNGPAATVVAHQGAGLDSPENSLAAFVKCKERGCTFVHFDLRLSRDLVPLCFHDDDLYRVAGIAKKFHDFSSTELRNLDISLKHHPNFRGNRQASRIPTFDEAVETCIRLNLKFFINLLDSTPHMVDIVCKAYKKYQAMYVMAVITSFHFKVVHDIRRRDNKIIGCVQFPFTHRLDASHLLDLGVGDDEERRHQSFFLLAFFHQWWTIFHDWIVENFFWWFLGLSAIIMEKNHMSKKQVSDWGQKGVRVFLWPVNHPMEKLYLNQVMSVGYLTDTLEGDVVLNPSSVTVQQLIDANHDRRQHEGPTGASATNKRTESMQSIPPSPLHPSDEALIDPFHLAAIKLNKQSDRKIEKKSRDRKVKIKEKKIDAATPILLHSNQNRSEVTSSNPDDHKSHRKIETRN